MRIFFILLCFTSCRALSFAQGEVLEAYYINDINAFSKIHLDSLWDFCPDGKISFDSLDTQAKWTAANPIYLRNDNGELLPWSGIGWFKQTFKVADSLKGKDIVLSVGHFGASEIYLDDSLLVRYGDVFAASGKNKSFSPRQPITGTLKKTSTHTLTVHYATHDFDKIFPPRLFSGFNIALYPLSESYSHGLNWDTHEVFAFTLHISFALFFFVVFLFYPKRIASLISAFLLLDIAIVFGCMLLGLNSTDVPFFFKMDFSWKCSIAVFDSLWFLLNYAIYYRKLPMRAWLVLPVAFINIIAIFYPSISKYIFAINALVFVETWRVIILGIRDKKIGAWILAIGQFFSFILVLIFVINIFSFPQLDFFNPGSYVCELFIPLTLALHLAWEFGSNNRVLQTQLTEVEKLSKENLEKELEKQHILETQNEMLEEQVGKRTSALNEYLSELKTTQNQLVQKEKLASLGELTAGIAHEIQNPLNFVNNFSELSVDLVKDVNAEINKETIDKDYVKDLMSDLTSNQEKINHHGKRASSIVKSMLEHSRTSTGERALTDINQLAHEYLRLSYHGLRAKDKTFNADYKTDFDATIPKINIVPQDIGRVILNLINNAFYAVNERAKYEQGRHAGLPLPIYAPLVTVSTKKIGEKIEIIVKDNGNGITDKIKEKIFQPFFTTKPTGEGTGLGLSLAYDIITKGHGGTLSVQSVEGEGSEFIIHLPLI